MANSNRRAFLKQAPAAAAAAVVTGAGHRAGPGRRRQADQEGPLRERQAAREDAALQQRRLLRQPGVHLRHRRALRRRHQGAHQARARRAGEEPRAGRLVDGEGAEGQRLPERPQGLRRHERDVPGPLRQGAGRAHDDCRGRRAFRATRWSRSTASPTSEVRHGCLPVAAGPVPGGRGGGVGVAPRSARPAGGRVAGLRADARRRQGHAEDLPGRRRGHRRRRRCAGSRRSASATSSPAGRGSRGRRPTSAAGSSSTRPAG